MFICLINALMPSENQQVLRLRLAYLMRRLLLSLLFIPFFTSSSWADPEKPSDNFWEDTTGSDRDVNDQVRANTKYEKPPLVKQGQQRPSGWRQKPTSIQRKSGGLQRKAR